MHSHARNASSNRVHNDKTKESRNILENSREIMRPTKKKQICLQVQVKRYASNIDFRRGFPWAFPDTSGHRASSHPCPLAVNQRTERVSRKNVTSVRQTPWGTKKDDKVSILKKKVVVVIKNKNEMKLSYDTCHVFTTTSHRKLPPKTQKYKM